MSSVPDLAIVQRVGPYPVLQGVLALGRERGVPGGVGLCGAGGLRDQLVGRALQLEPLLRLHAAVVEAHLHIRSVADSPATGIATCAEGSHWGMQSRVPRAQPAPMWAMSTPTSAVKLPIGSESSHQVDRLLQREVQHLPPLGWAAPRPHINAAIEELRACTDQGCCWPAPFPAHTVENACSSRLARPQSWRCC